MSDFTSGWTDWNNAFGQIPQINSPAELHGLLTGLAIFSDPPSKQDWQDILTHLEFEQPEDEALTLLTEETEDMAALLADGELDLAPVLPDDEHVLEERVRTLADWANGLLLGIGLMGQKEYSADDKELLEDLQDIAQLDARDNLDDHSEDDLEELLEFARLVPVSLAAGRKRIPFNQTELYRQIHKNGESEKEPMKTAVVDFFTPDHRPS